MLSRFIYGYYPDEEVFYRVSFYTTWALDISKLCIQRGSINNYAALTYNCLEFILQFYIDNQIYLNTLYMKNVTFRKTEHFEEASQEGNSLVLLNKEKLKSLKHPLVFNDIPASSSCLLELDVTVDDIVRPKYVKHFPTNPTHMPSLPGVIELWNDQYRRFQRNHVDYSSFIDVLRNKVDRAPEYTSLQNKIDKKLLKVFIKQENYTSSQHHSFPLVADKSLKSPVEKHTNEVVVLDEDATAEEGDEALDEEALEEEVLEEEAFEDEVDEGEEDADEYDEMNYTLAELELYDQASSNDMARTLYSLEDPIVETDGNNSRENVPQLDGMDDTPPEVSRKNDDLGKVQSSPTMIDDFYKFQNKKIRLTKDSLASKTVSLPKLSLSKLSTNSQVVINEQLSQRSSINNKMETPTRRTSLQSDSSIDNTRRNSLDCNLLDTTIQSSPFIAEAEGCLQSTPQNTSKQRGGKRKASLLSNSRRRSSLNSTLRVTLDSIFEQQVLQTTIKPQVLEPLKFVLSQSSQSSISQSPKNDISSFLTADSTDHSMDAGGPLISRTSLVWNRCLEMTLMSLELHIKTRGNLTACPTVDPVQMVIFAVYNEELGDELSSSAASTETETQDESLHFAYIGAIAVRPMQKGQPQKYEEKEVMLVDHKKVTVHYVPTEADLLLHLIDGVRAFDPDIMVGYTVDTLSWGYLIQRAFVLDIDPLPLCRITNPYQAKSNFEGDVNKPPLLVGRIIFNLWTLLKPEENSGLSLRSYTFEHVYHELFRERLPRYSNDHLNRLWGKGFRGGLGTVNRITLLEYYLARVTGNIRMLAQVNLVPRTYGLAALFGMRFEDALTRGSQFRVESILFPLVHRENFLPIRFPKEKVSAQAAPEFIQLVLEPDSSFHSEPVAVLDFNSLYPSVMIAYNYCFSTCLGKLKNIFR